MKIKFQGTAASINDPHIPFQDQRTLHEVELFLKDLQPELLLIIGDVGDFYQISKFDKNPLRKQTMYQDLSKVKSFHRRIRSILPNTRIIEEEGNHEDRWRKFLWTKVPELADFEELRLDKLYGLDECEIEHIPYSEGLLVNGVFLASHGDMIRAHSGYTAKGMSDKHGGCGIHGHTHRGGSYYKRDRFGIWGWWENFCLCNLDPDWIANPNWQQGFSLVHFTKSRFWVEPIPIISEKFMYGGTLYGSGRKARNG